MKRTFYHPLISSVSPTRYRSWTLYKLREGYSDELTFQFVCPEDLEELKRVYLLYAIPTTSTDTLQFETELRVAGENETLDKPPDALLVKQEYLQGKPTYSLLKADILGEQFLDREFLLKKTIGIWTFRNSQGALDSYTKDIYALGIEIEYEERKSLEIVEKEEL